MIEIVPGKTELTVDQTNRLMRQQGLCLAVAQAWVIDQITHSIELDPEEEKAVLLQHARQQNINSDEDLAAWLQQRGWSFEDYRWFATRQARLALFKQNRFGEEVEVQFLEQKLKLDSVTYSLIRVQDKDLADELYQQIREGESDFASLASHYSQGMERQNRGLIGPVSLAAGHADLVQKLRVSKPGQLWPPFWVGDVWVILRLEQLQAAELDDSVRKQMLDALFQQWFNTRVESLMHGEELTALS